MSQSPRKPGSQVAPGQKPLFTNGRTASTHSKVPVDQATAGKLYRVRDKDWAAVWGENLTWTDANQLKNQVVGSRRSTTARVEDMAISPPDWYVAQNDALPVADLMSLAAEIFRPQGSTDPAAIWPGAQRQPDGTVVVPLPGLGAAFELAGLDPQKVPSRGVVTAHPPGCELLVNGEVRSLPAVVQEGDTLLARPLDPELASARGAALIAAQNVAAQAQGRHAQARQAKLYRDMTVRVPPPRTQPAPRDKTVAKEPVLVRLGAPPSAPPRPPPSPLKVATELDGEPLSPDALTDADLPDIAGDVGGGPSEADLEHAKRQQG